MELDIQTKKSSIEEIRLRSTDIENEVNELKKKLSVQNKEINDFRKKVNSIEAKLLDKKLERHGILKTAKLELVELPMVVGTMDDISDEDQSTLTQQQTQQPPSDQSTTNTESLNTLASADQASIFQKEARIKIDYKQLDTEFLNVSDYRVVLVREKNLILFCYKARN